ncbi:4-carboxymuconolactone decarboxylase [Oikeobacillus pervagus]|uniref:4-carboxymuconolactone decarboxylase n=1 Tax=Oikeobacillus pervagus TaxID=1325931 RepID=A0AAJ1T2L3_9BACI|nr:carboxymuconolactone decarboxylase family protein [Oikeobacillus pervagus]MDQ0216027.1 4-carboxymuconolactone decarboxylase [Oikeobacillus pervagus]
MDQERFQKGVNKLKEYTSEEQAQNLVHSDVLKDIAPDLRRFIVEFAYGDIYTRPGLNNKERALVTITTLVTQGVEPQIETHVNRGLTSGLTPNEIVEGMLQLIPYVGFPRVQNALKIVKKVLEQRDLKVEI